MQLCRINSFKVRPGGGNSKVISLPAESLVEVGEKRWILREESTGTVLLVTDEVFKEKYADKFGITLE